MVDSRNAAAAATLVALALGTTPAFAQTAISKLSPAAQAELQKLSPADRAALAQQLMGGTAATTPAAAMSPPAAMAQAGAPPTAMVAAAPVPAPPKHDGNDLLCTAFGCVGGTLMAAGSAYGMETNGSYPDNFGWVLGGNIAAPIPFLSQYGLGVQLSGSKANYNFGGKASPGSQLTGGSDQSFLSVGLFRRPDVDGVWWSRFGVGAVTDFAWLKNSGDFGATASLQQLRYKVSYDVMDQHEIGIWGVKHIGSSECYPAGMPAGNTCALGLTLNTRSLDQLNFFYKYNLDQGGSLSAYIGPGIDDGPKAQGGFPVTGQYQGARYTLGADGTVPVSDYVALFSNIAYAAPHTSHMRGISPTGNTAAAEQDWSVMAGVRFYWGGNARVREDTGRHWMPYVPDLNNSGLLQASSANE